MTVKVENTRRRTSIKISQCDETGTTGRGGTRQELLGVIIPSFDNNRMVLLHLQTPNPQPATLIPELNSKQKLLGVEGIETKKGHCFPDCDGGPYVPEPSALTGSSPPARACHAMPHQTFEKSLLMKRLMSHAAPTLDESRRTDVGHRPPPRTCAPVAAVSCGPAPPSPLFHPTIPRTVRRHSL